MGDPQGWTAQLAGQCKHLPAGMRLRKTPTRIAPARCFTGAACPRHQAGGKLFESNRNHPSRGFAGTGDGGASAVENPGGTSMITSRLTLVLAAATVSLGLALSPTAFAQGMGKDNMAKDKSTMSKDKGTKKDTMGKNKMSDGMKKK
jgi:pentapeptide MXKDX repeat protein